MGAADTALGVVATFCVDGWLEEEVVVVEDGVVDDEGLDDDGAFGGDEKGLVNGELDEEELEPELEEDVDELVEVEGCNSWHISKAVSLSKQVNAASKSTPEQSPVGTHEV